MLRGYDWNNWYSLAYKDITVSKQDYVAQYVISYDLYTQGKYSESKMYALRSINIYPSPENYNDLGLAFSGLDDYKDAANAYRHEILFEDGEQLGYENLGSLTLVSGSLNSNKQFLLMALKVYPQDSLLWEYLAILEYKYHDDMDAKYAITKANEYGNVPRFLYNGIMYEKSLKIELTAKKVVLIL